jgi:hypothetical protein
MKSSGGSELAGKIVFDIKDAIEETVELEEMEYPLVVELDITKLYNIGGFNDHHGGKNILTLWALTHRDVWVPIVTIPVDEKMIKFYRSPFLIKFSCSGHLAQSIEGEEFNVPDEIPQT